MAPKKKGPSEVGGKDARRVTWSKESLHIFCDLCIQFAEKHKGKHGATISHRMEWKILAVQFQKKTGLPYDKSKLKHKWDWMRIRWRLWKALKWKEAGLGWDHEKGTISASEEWWEDKIKENSHFKVFQDEGIEPELEDKMEQLFGVSVALGVHKFTPAAEPEKETKCLPLPPPPSTHSASGNVDHDDSTSECGAFNQNQTNMEWQKVWNDCSPRGSTSSSPPPLNEQGVEKGGSKRKLENGDFGSKKISKFESSRRVGESSLLMEKLGVMIQAITDRNMKDMELLKLEARALVNSSPTVADSLAKLLSLPGLMPKTPEFNFACTLIEDPQKRIILNGLPDDDARLHWIKYLHKREK